MPNVHLTGSMEEYVSTQIKSGAYSNVSEVLRAGVRLLMEKEGARQFYVLRTELEDARQEAEAGAFETFDPQAYEPDAFKA